MKRLARWGLGILAAFMVLMVCLVGGAKADSVTSIDSTAFSGCSQQLLIVCSQDSAAAKMAMEQGILWFYP